MRRSRRVTPVAMLLVIQGVEAGGHVRGTVGLFPLLEEVREVVELPLVAAGGIGTGRAMAAALTAGADAVRVGTRFVAARESIAHPAYVAALIASEAEDTVITTAFGDGWPDAPHRVLTCLDAGTRLVSAQSWGPNWPTADDGGPVEAARCTGPFGRSSPLPTGGVRNSRRTRRRRRSPPHALRRSTTELLVARRLVATNSLAAGRGPGITRALADCLAR